MKAANGPLILIAFCAVILAVCWFVITALTTPSRAIAGGLALSAAAGLFIWFAPSNRFAMARGVIALGATALAAPIAAVQVATNDIMFSLLADEDLITERFLSLDHVMEVGWRNAGIGAAVAVVLIIIGGVMHRTPRPQD